MHSTSRAGSTTAPARAGGSDSRRQLIRAATGLFHQQGALATSVRDITAACGLTPGALYNHFSSKEELLYTIVLEIHTTLDTHLQAAHQACGDDPVDQLTAVVTALLARHFRSRERVRVANREYQLLTGRRRAEVVEVRRRLRDRVVGIIELGAAQGIFHPVGGGGRRAAVLTATAILDMCVHISEWYDSDGELSMTELQHRYTAMALRMAGLP